MSLAFSFMDNSVLSCRFPWEVLKLVLSIRGKEKAKIAFGLGVGNLLKHESPKSRTAWVLFSTTLIGWNVSGDSYCIKYLPLFRKSCQIILRVWILRVTSVTSSQFLNCGKKSINFGVNVSSLYN